MKDIDENVEDSFMDVDAVKDEDSDGDSGPSTSRAAPTAGPRHANKTASETYQKVRMHVISITRDGAEITIVVSN